MRQAFDHVTGCHLTQETRVTNAYHDVASNVYPALQLGRHAKADGGQGLALVHVRAQTEQLQDTFMS
jgi:hypothetical protein